MLLFLFQEYPLKKTLNESLILSLVPYLTASHFMFHFYISNKL